MKEFNLEEVMANGGKCQTRDGRAARIICTDLDAAQPVVVVVQNLSCGDMIYTISTDGRYYGGGSESLNDLIPLPKRIQREYWANGYATGQFGFYSSREGADLNAGARIACVRVVIDCEEGEGLEEAT